VLRISSPCSGFIDLLLCFWVVCVEGVAVRVGELDGVFDLCCACQLLVCGIDGILGIPHDLRASILEVDGCW